MFSRQLSFDGSGYFTYESAGGATVESEGWQSNPTTGESGWGTQRFTATSMNKNAGAYSVHGEQLILEWNDGTRQQF